MALLLATAPVLALTGVAIVAALQAARSSAGVEWTSYHFDNSRSANPKGGTYVRTVSRAWAQSDLDAPVYAEPLVYRGRVFVVTENDSLYALDASTGRVEWRLHLATAATNPGFGCGNIDPLGITSTPVIDAASGRLYTAGVVDTVSGSPRYQTRLFAVDISSRSVMFNVRVDLPGADVETHNQRGALTLTGGRVYIPFGGRAGDCGRYHGAITSVLASNGQGLISFRSTDGDLTGGGFWAPGGLAVSEDGDILGATGNAMFRGSYCGASFQFQNTVLRLSPTLTSPPADYWTPPNWRELDCSDADIGAIVPTVLPRTGLIFQSGKAGWAYLLRESSLGHIGPAAFGADLRSGECRGGAAFDGVHVFVGCQGGLLGLRIQRGGPSLDPPGRGGWRHPTSGCDAEPPILAAGAVWWLDRCHTLHVNDARTGRAVFTYDVASGNHFATPSAALGKVFVPIERGVVAFAINPRSTG